MTGDRESFVITLLAGAGGLMIFIGTVVMMALRIQDGLAKEFEKHRKLMYRMFAMRDRAIRRIEYALVKSNAVDFQPGADPVELMKDDSHNNDGNEEAH